MKDQFNVEAVGILQSVEKWQSKKGLVYAKGRLLCQNPAVIVPFSSFSEEFNDLLFSDNVKSERIKIAGRASEWNDGINIVVSQLVRAGSDEKDKSNFTLIGTLREFQEDGQVMFATIETKQRSGNKDVLNNVSVIAEKSELLKEKLMHAENRRVLAKGILKQLNMDGEGDARIMCWVISIDMLSEMIAGNVKPDSENVTNNT